MKWTLFVGAIGMLAGGTAFGQTGPSIAEQWQHKAQCEQHRADAALLKAQALEDQLRQAQAQQSQAQAQAAQAKQAMVDVQTSLLFPVNGTKPVEKPQKELAPVLTAVEATPDAAILVEGHADSTGSEQYNQALSMKRAEEVKQELVAQGVSPQQIETKALGETEPEASNATSSGRAANRRVDIIVKAGPGME